MISKYSISYEIKKQQNVQPSWRTNVLKNSETLEKYKWETSNSLIPRSPACQRSNHGTHQKKHGVKVGSSPLRRGFHLNSTSKAFERLTGSYPRLIHPISLYMGVSQNSFPPNHPFLIGFSIINHPFWGYPYCWKHPWGWFSTTKWKYWASCVFDTFLTWLTDLPGQRPASTALAGGARCALQSAGRLGEVGRLCRQDW